MLEGLLQSSMITADIRDEAGQREWRANLSRLIQESRGVILLIDAVDEMTSLERSEFMNDIAYKMHNVPGTSNY